MRCADAQAQLAAAHDGELGPSAVKVLEEHLARCPRCRRWDEELRALPLGGSLRVPVDVRRELEARTDPRRLVPGPPRSERRLTVVGVLAAAAVGAIAIGQGVTGRATNEPTVVHAPIPADQWREAAFRPEHDEAPAYDTNVLHLPNPSTDGVTR